MKYFYSLIILSFFGTSFLHAQSNFKPGYVVNAANDTLKGFVDYREWGANPETIFFKKDLSSKMQEYTPANANAFAVTGLEYYEKFVVQVSQSGPNEEARASEIDTTYIVDTVFLKPIIKGKYINLYKYTDKIKTRYYVLNNISHGVDELKYYSYFNGETSTMVDVTSYRRQLFRIVANQQAVSEKLTSVINRCKYNEDDLVRVFLAINDGGTQQAIYKNASGMRFFVGLGARNSKLTFNGVNPAFSDGTNKSSFSPVIAGGIDLLINKHTQRLLFRFELEAANNHFNFANILTGYSGEHVSLDLKQYVVSIMPQVIYNFYSAENLKIFAGAGFSVNIAAYNNYNYSTTTSFGLTSIRNKYPDFQHLYFNFPLRAGVLINKRIEVYGLYTSTSSMTDYASWSAGISGYQAGINYLFGK
jgi:hypothetical protein